MLLACKCTCLQELNTLLKGNLEASAQDALTALSAVTNKQQAVLQLVEAAIARVEAEVAALELSKRDRLAVRVRKMPLPCSCHQVTIHMLCFELIQFIGHGSWQRQLDHDLLAYLACCAAAACQCWRLVHASTRAA